MKQTPRDYQLELIDNVRKCVAAGNRRIVVQSETGSGKTMVMSHITEAAVAKGKSVLILAHMRELVSQTSRKLSQYGVEHGVIMAGELNDKYSPVQVSSKDTLISRIKAGRMELPKADLVMVDEGDRAMGLYYSQLVDRYTCPTLFFTATPCDGEGYGMGDFADAMVCGPPPSWLIANGYLVPSRVWAPPGPNLKGIRYDSGGLAGRAVMSRIMKPQVVGDIISHWEKHGKGRPTVLFARNIDHSTFLRDRFRDAGYRSEHVDKDTPSEGPGSRQECFQGLARGDVDVLCNVGILEAGVDIPEISCVILASPDRSIRRYRQRIGRGKRPCGDKKDLYILDHAGTCRYLGMPDEDIEWVLDSRLRVKTGPKKKGEKKQITCLQCYCVYQGQLNCPSCGWSPSRRPKDDKNAKAGVLYEVTDVGDASATERIEAVKREKNLRIWNRVLGICANKGYKFRQACGMYKSNTGSYPPDDFPHVPQRGSGDWDERVADKCPRYLSAKRED